jgi:hypothetical protein
MNRTARHCVASVDCHLDEPMMTEAQRDELKTLCQKADVPDKTGELLTQEGAQHFIDELKNGQLPLFSSASIMNIPQ